ADGEKRYPLDTAPHIRAAWAYIHHAANAARYTPAQLAHVKERIAGAWEQRIDPAGPPAAHDQPERQSEKRALDSGTDVQQLIQQAHDRLCRAGAQCHAADGAEAHPMKSAGHGDLAKMLSTDIAARLDALAKRVEDIAQTPL